MHLGGVWHDIGGGRTEEHILRSLARCIISQGLNKFFSAQISQRGCLHRDVGHKLPASGICHIPCAYPLPKSPLRAPVKMALLVACIRAPKDPYVQPFQK